MINLRAKNNDLTAGKKYSYLNTNYASGVNEVVVSNSDGFENDQYVLIGEWGNETSEIMKITGVTAATHTISFAAETTKFSHSESTRITIISYNQIKYYWTALATFDSDNLLDTIDVQADSLHTIFGDSNHSTGFGFFKFYNSTNSKISAASNAIPYTSFANQSIKKVLDSFYSLLNSKEQKLISNTDALNYLNEAYAIIVSELNLVNENYNVPADEDFSIVSGISEYALPDDFSKVISLYNGTNKISIPFISLDEVAAWNNEASNTVRYSLRNNYLVITPEPTENITYSMKFKKKSDILSSFYENIDLPDHGEYLLINFMMHRASIKMQNGQAGMFLKLFQNDIQRLKISSHKRSNNNDDWSIADSANI